MTSTQTTIFGYSDDLVEFEGAIYGEATSNSSDENDIVLTAPSGEKLELTVEFCGVNPDGWGNRIEHDGTQAPGPITFGVSPDNDDDAAITITHPEGTTATCNGEDVR